MNLMDLFVKIDVDDKASGQISGVTDKFKKAGSAIGGGLATAAKIGTAAITAASTAVAALAKASMDQFAEYEQLVGGVDTLFKDSSLKVQGYADKAYKTAGLSANDYMETVTSFSASLLQSLEQDTETAAGYADRAITDMSDNANKMGTDISMIQNAYQGFAKANYTMLDNLKLGYGGTQAEMQRLIEDAASMTDVQAELGITVDATSMSFANVVNAISVVQKNMGITGTTAKEAGTTIKGSVASMKAAWSNLLVSIANDNDDFGEKLDEFIITIVGDGSDTNLGVFGNIFPTIERVLEGIGDLLNKIAPIISEKLPGLVTTVLPPILSAATSLIGGILSALPSLIQLLLDEAPKIIKSMAGAFSSVLPQIKSVGTELIVYIVEGVIQGTPTLLSEAARILTDFAAKFDEAFPGMVSEGVRIIEAVALGIADNIGEIIAAIVSVINTMISELTKPETLNRLLSAALTIVESLAYGIIDAIPGLASAAGAILTGFVDLITDQENLKRLLGAATGIIGSLSDYVIENADDIGDSVVEIVNEIVDFFSDEENLGDLISAAGEIIGKIGAGIVATAWELGESAAEISTTIIEKIFETDWVEVGKDIVRGIGDGLTSIGEVIAEKLKESGVGEAISNFFGFENAFNNSSSPSLKPFGSHASGIPYIPYDGYVAMLHQGERVLTAEEAAKYNNGNTSATYLGGVTININGGNFDDVEELADAVAERLQDMTDRREAVYA